MAALTSDRRGSYKVRPEGFAEEFELDAADTVIYSHSLVALSADDGLVPAAAGSAEPILYSPRHYDADSTTMHRGIGGDADLARVWSGVIALLDATGLAAGDVGRNVFVDDDHTVSTSADESTETRPKAGKVVKVISATEAIVYIPGLTE